MLNHRIPPRDGERIDDDSCPDCFHLKEECACEPDLNEECICDPGLNLFCKVHGVPECSSAHTDPNEVNGRVEHRDGETYWMGNLVKKCPMCGVAPTNVDDCGCFGNPECPYFGIGIEAYKKANTQQGQTNFHSPMLAELQVPERAPENGDEARNNTVIREHESCEFRGVEELCEWFDNLPKPPEPLPWLPQEKATDRHPFA